MKTRAEQLKMLLAHRQAHHITLLASVLLLIHRHEIQQFDLPPPPPPQQQQQVLSTSRLVTHSPSRLSSLGSPSRLSDNGQGLTAYKQALELPAAVGTKAAAAAAVPVDKEQQQQGQQQARIVVAAGLDLGGEGLGEDDEFYMPVRGVTVYTHWERSMGHVCLLLVLNKHICCLAAVRAPAVPYHAMYDPVWMCNLA